jgi:hypothetical protein
MWTKLHFGKHAGRTLPQVILSDPNWFFWAVSKDVLVGQLGIEAEALERRARNIRIPKPKPKEWEIEYRFDHDLRFLGFGFVKANCIFHAAYSSYLPHLDLAYVRRGHIHDIRDCRQLISDVRRLYFQGLNLTKKRCESFFDDERNSPKRVGDRC